MPTHKLVAIEVQRVELLISQKYSDELFLKNIFKILFYFLFPM